MYLPCSTAILPLTITYSIPAGYRNGFLYVARSRNSRGSKTAMSANLPFAILPRRGIPTASAGRDVIFATASSGESIARSVTNLCQKCGNAPNERGCVRLPVFIASCDMPMPSDATIPAGCRTASLVFFDDIVRPTIATLPSFPRIISSTASSGLMPPDAAISAMLRPTTDCWSADNTVMES